MSIPKQREGHVTLKWERRSSHKGLKLADQSADVYHLCGIRITIWTEHWTLSRWLDLLNIERLGRWIFVFLGVSTKNNIFFNFMWFWTVIGTLIINQLFECQRYKKGKMSWYCVTLSLHVALHVHPIYQPTQCNLVWLYNNRKHRAECDRPTRCDSEVVASTKTDIKNLFLFLESWQTSNSILIWVPFSDEP